MINVDILRRKTYFAIQQVHVMDTSRISIANASQSVSSSIETESTPVLFTFNATESKHFNRMGFSYAIMWAESANTKFNELLKAHEEEQHKQLEFIEQHYQLDLNRFDDRIQRLQTQVDDLQLSLEQLETGTTSNLTKKEALISKIQELKETIYVLYESLGLEKHQLIETRIETIQSELHQITKNYDELTTQRNDALKKVYETGKATTNIKLDIFKSHAEIYKARLSHIDKKVPLLNEAQVADTATLKGILLLSNVASGVFFAMFAVAANLNSETVFFFIISAIMKFGETLIHKYGHIGAFGYMLGGCLAILVIILGFAWACNRILYPNKKNNATSKIDFELNDDEASFKTQLSASNIFDFLLQVAPVILVVSIFFILLVVGNASKDIPKLDMALSGLAAGMAITVILGAIAFIYISKVIEPRFEKQNTYGFTRSRANVELFLLIGLFLIIFLLLLFGIDTLFSNRLLPLLLFAITALPTAVATAYGIWYDGILRTLTHLERKSKELADAIKDNSRARDELFPKKFLELESELWGLIINKTKIAQKFLPIDAKQSLPLATKNKLDAASLKLSFDEAVYFPHIENALKTLQTELKVKRKELKKLNVKIDESLNSHKNEKKELRELIEKIYNKISNYQKEVVKCHNKWVETRNTQIEKGQKEWLALVDGFKLGKWYLEQLSISKNDSVSSQHIQETDSVSSQQVQETDSASSQQILENDITSS